MVLCIFFFRFKSYEYQLLQGAAAQDKEVRCTWRCYVISKPEDDERAQISFSDLGTIHLFGDANRQIACRDGRYMRQSVYSKCFDFIWVVGVGWGVVPHVPRHAE